MLIISSMWPHFISKNCALFRTSHQQFKAMQCIRHSFYWPMCHRTCLQVTGFCAFSVTQKRVVTQKSRAWRCISHLTILANVLCDRTHPSNRTKLGGIQSISFPHSVIGSFLLLYIHFLRVSRLHRQPIHEAKAVCGSSSEHFYYMP
jgi:hypothetical protein